MLSYLIAWQALFYPDMLQRTHGNRHGGVGGTGHVPRRGSVSLLAAEMLPSPARGLGQRSRSGELLCVVRVEMCCAFLGRKQDISSRLFVPGAETGVVSLTYRLQREED